MVLQRTIESIKQNSDKIDIKNYVLWEIYYILQPVCIRSVNCGKKYGAGRIVVRQRGNKSILD